MQRVKTGVFGLDELIEGGMPKGRIMLVSGGCGTGKTIFGLQFLYYGVKNYKEPGIYVTLDERPELIREDCLKFGWDLKKMEHEKMLEIIDGTIARIGFQSEEEYSLPATGYDVDKLLIEIMRAIKRIDAKRVVIDSIPSLGFNIETETEIRKTILKLSYVLMKSGVTSIITSEIQEGENKFGKYGVEEYVADGVIVLHFLNVGMQSNRTLQIRKMRATKHSEDIHPIEITDKGIVVHKIEEEYKL